MNSRVLQSHIINTVSQFTGASKKQTEQIFKAFFSIIAEALSEGESVKVKNLGTFKVSSVEARRSVNVSTGESYEIPAHKKVTFVPCKELADNVNADFSWLDLVEISENLTNDELNAVTADPSEIFSQVAEGGSKVAAVDIISSDKEGEELGEKLEEEFGMPEPTEPFGPIDPDDPEPNQPVPEEVYNARADLERIEKKNRKRFRSSVITAVVCSVAVMCIGFFLLYYFLLQHIETIYKQSPQNNVAFVEESASKSNTLENNNNGIAEGSAPSAVVAKEPMSTDDVDDKAIADTPQSDILTIDAISHTRYLTTMAKDYYGNYNFWPYIYIENEKHLGHPDRIKPGTKIQVPYLSKYNVDVKNPEDINKAKQLGAEIYNRFK